MNATATCPNGYVCSWEAHPAHFKYPWYLESTGGGAVVVLVVAIAVVLCTLIYWHHNRKHREY